MPAQPQDRKPKKGTEYRFKHNGKTYTLPPAGSFAKDVPGGVTMDAILNPDDDMAQLRLGLSMLSVAKVSDGTTQAIRSMSTEDMLSVLGEWMTHKADDEASLGESSGSST